MKMPGLPSSERAGNVRFSAVVWALGALWWSGGSAAGGGTFAVRDFGQLAARSATPTSITLTFSFSGLVAAPSFSLANGNDYTLGASACALAATTTCSVPVNFVPLLPGLRADSLSVEDQFGNVLAVTFLHGIGLAPQMVFYPGIINTYAGNGTWGYLDTTPASNAEFRNPQGVAVDAQGNVYVADSVNQVVRRVALNGTVTSYAGNGTSGYSGDGAAAGSAQLNDPTGVAVDAAGNVYIADQGNNCIREVNGATKIISTVAGGSTVASGTDTWGDGGPATSAVLYGPSAVVVDYARNLYIADSYHHVVREVYAPSGLIGIVAGGGSASGTDGLGDGGPAVNAQLSNPAGLAMDAAGNLYIADSSENRIRLVNRTTGVISSVAGNGNYGYKGDGGAAVNATLAGPAGIALDAGGNMYIADFANNAIRQVAANTGVISTIAGSGANAYSGDGGIPVLAGLSNPSSVTLDYAGNIYIADYANNVIREISVGPPALNFGSEPVGAASAMEAVVPFNIGNQNIAFSGGSLSANFQQVSSGGNDCTGSSVLAPGGSCVAALVFAPLSTGSVTGSLTISANPANLLGAVQAASLRGVGSPGTGPHVSLSTAALSFGTQPVGTVSGVLTATLSNSGGAALAIASIWLAGAAARDFQITTNCGNSVAAGASCTLSLRFAPTTWGARAATLTVNDSAATSPQALTLSGTGQAGTISLSNSSLNFTETLGLTTEPRAITVSNTSTLQVSILSVWLSGVNSADFGPTSTCGATLAAGASCQVSVNFTPGAAGARTASLTITDTSLSSPHVVALMGTGAATVSAPNSEVFAAGTLQLTEGARLNFGVFYLTMQTDGNLVLSQSGTQIWTSGTGGQNCATNQCFATFQSDGNFVVYNGSKALWNSATAGSQLILSTQMPYLQVVSANQSILWASAYTFSAGNLRLAEGARVNFGVFYLMMQTDGNLVLYQGTTAVWASGTSCASNQCYAVFQNDGNMVVYNGATPLWYSGTAGNLLVLSAQLPHLQIVSANQSILWSDSNTFSAGNLRLPEGARVRFGALFLTMQTDGNFVLYQGTTALWDSGTSCTSAQCYAIFQSDGNFVVYDGSKPLWNSGTAGYQLIFSAQLPHMKIVTAGQSIVWTDSSRFSAGNLNLPSGAKIKFGALSLTMQTDGNFVLYQGTTPLWYTGTICVSSVCHVTFQSDGNLVVYNGTTPLWNSGTSGHVGAALVLSAQNSNITIIGSNQAVLWVDD